MEWLKTRNIEQFNGTRYGPWKFRIKSLLEELQVLHVIEDSSPEHQNAEWTAKNSVAKCTIVNFLGDGFLHLAAGNATAKSIMDSLDMLYEKRSLSTQLALRKQLFNLKLLPNVGLLKHFSIFDTLIGKLKYSGANLDEMDKICHLLMTLPFSYEKVIVNIQLLNEDQFNLAFIKTVLLDHEARMEMEAITKLKECQPSYIPNNKRQNEAVTNRPYKKRKLLLNYPNNRNFNRNPSYNVPYCDYCKRRNHYIQECHFYNRLMNDSAIYMQPQFVPKVNGNLKRIATSHNKITPPCIDLTKVKIEPVSVKQEVVIIKQEPIEPGSLPLRIKQEPVWDAQPVVVKTEPNDGQPGTSNGQPGTSNGQPGTYNGNDAGKKQNNSKKSRRRKRMRANIIAMYIQANNAAQQPGTHELAMTSVQN